MTARDMWHHVKSEDNPADIISRGVNPKQLQHLRLWWHGPEWLCKPEEHLCKKIPPVLGEIPETRLSLVTYTQVSEVDDIFARFSSLSRMKRVLAYCLRWRKPCTKSNAKPTRALSIDELDRAMKLVIKSVQGRCFPREVIKLKTKQRVHHDNPLLTLYPFLDNEGIIRVGGRLNNAPISYERQHPIVLPPNNHVTHLIIRDAHLKNLHLGAQALHSTLQESFWILSARSIIRKILHKILFVSERVLIRRDTLWVTYQSIE